MVRKLIALLGFCAIPLAAGCHEIVNFMYTGPGNGDDDDCGAACTTDRDECVKACDDDGGCIKACDDGEMDCAIACDCIKACDAGETDLDCACT